MAIDSSNLGFGGNPYLGQNNPYLQQNIDSTMTDISRNYNLAVQPNTASSMVKSGSFGNSGLDQMQGEQQRQLAQTMGNTASAMRGQDYNQQQQMYQWDQGFNNNVYQQGVNNNNTNLNNWMNLQQLNSNVNTQDINNAATIQNMPLQYQEKFANMANGIGQGYGTSSTQMPGSPVMGALGGWQLGTAFNKPA